MAKLNSWASLALLVASCIAWITFGIQWGSKCVAGGLAKSGLIDGDNGISLFELTIIEVAVFGALSFWIGIPIYFWRFLNLVAEKKSIGGALSEAIREYFWSSIGLVGGALCMAAFVFLVYVPTFFVIHMALLFGGIALAVLSVGMLIYRSFGEHK